MHHHKKCRQCSFLQTTDVLKLNLVQQQKSHGDVLFFCFVFFFVKDHDLA